MIPAQQTAANDAVIAHSRCRTLPIAQTLSAIKGYPSKLRIYQTRASKNWQVRCFFAPSMLIRSLRTTNKKEAIQRAKLFYEQELLLRGRHLLAHSQESAWLGHGMEKAVCMLVAHEAARLARGEITQQSFQITCQRARGEISAFFKDITVERIDRALVERFVTDLSAKQIRASTIKAYLVVLRKLLTRCLHEQWIERLPVFPQIKAPTAPRGHFTVSEYVRLLRAAKHLRQHYAEPTARATSHRSTKGGIFTATQGVPHEMAWLIGFMVNSFVRPVDAKVIQHKHVEIVRGERCYLRLRLPETKRHSAQVITMPAAVHIYERLREHHGKSALASPDHYLFLPRVEDRGVAIWLMDRYFGKVLDATGLRLGARGQRRTLYSLRHSSITFRLLYGEGIDLLTLARNARTSLEMVDKFYASELSAEMNVGMLHSRR